MLMRTSCNVVFLIFPIHVTFQSAINEAVYFPLLKKFNSAIMIFNTNGLNKTINN